MSTPPKPSGLQPMLKKILWRHRWLFFGLLFLNLALQGLYLVFPYLTKLQLDQLTSQHTELFGAIASSPFRLFIFIVLAYLLMQLVGSVIEQISYYVNNRLTFILGRDFLSEVVSYLQRFDASLLTGKRNELIVSSLRDASNTIYQIWWMGRDIATNLVQFLILLPLITKIDSRLFIILVISNGLLLLLNLYDERINRQLEPVNDKIGNTLWATEWVLTGPKLFDLYLVGGEKEIMTRHQNLLTKQYQHNQAVVLGGSMRSFLRAGIGFLSVAAITTLVGRSVFSGAMTIGTFTMVTMYAGQLSSALSNVFDTIRSSVETRLRWRKFKYLYTLPTGYQKPIGTANQSALQRRTVELQMSNLTFAYPNMARHERQYLRYLLKDAEVATKRMLVNRYTSNELKTLVSELTREIKKTPDVLENITVDFKPGTITAIVGENGAGKSTLVKLLLRAYDPSTGTVTFNNEPFVNYQPKVLREKIGFLSQEPFLIDGLSVKENLTLGCSRRLSDQDINAVLSEVKLDTVIQALPKKLHSKIGSDTDLSGGQRQLLALTRLILQDRPVIIMDEGSSQLDALRELLIMKKLRQLASKKQKTVILITHRLTTARHADMIYVLNKGRVTEHGTHQQLMTHPRGRYHALWQAQVGD